jgi:estrogen-related receptor beta like 1
MTESTNPSTTTSAPSPYPLAELLELIYYRLQLLKYNVSFLPYKPELKPVTMFTFSNECNEIANHNTSGTFEYFAQVCIWLFAQCGISYDLQWYDLDDDPNMLSTLIINILQEQFQYSSTTGNDVSMIKLRTGNSEECILILDYLTQKALKSVEFRLDAPDYSKTIQEDDNELHHNGSTTNLNEEGEVEDTVEEEYENSLDDEDDDDGFEADEDHTVNENFICEAELEEIKRKRVLEQDLKQRVEKARIDSKQWALECERVTSQLVLANVAAGKEWRAHLEASQSHLSQLQSTISPSTTLLTAQASQWETVCSRIAAQEKHLQVEYEHITEEMKSILQENEAKRKTYSELSAKVAKLNEDYAKQCAAVEELSNKMAEKNDAMSDTTPLRKLDETIKGLKIELTEMEVRMGVMQQMIGQTQLRAQVEEGRKLRREEKERKARVAHRTSGGVAVR